MATITKLITITGAITSDLATAYAYPLDAGGDSSGTVIAATAAEILSGATKTKSYVVSVTCDDASELVGPWIVGLGSIGGYEPFAEVAFIAGEDVYRASGGGSGDASQTTLLAVKAKTDLITSQTVNQTVDPLNTLRIVRGDSFAGSVTVTTDYSGYTATFTIRHRVTDVVLVSASATIDSSTSIGVALTTTETAFALLTLADEFGPHPFDVQLVSGSTQNTERGIAIITRDETRA